ncbi:MAG: MarR family transcriptional regulator [Deltaproteobacteria bacterium]|nr:MAG: MarR family transcriptional regulator [Deltaproteobacteria bacterium]
MRPLSARQLEVLDTLRAFAEQHGRMPSVRELARRLERSASTVQQHLDALVRKGWLLRDGGAHGLRLAGGTTGAAGAVVPLTGLLTHGEAIRPPPPSRQRIPVPAPLADPTAFALCIRGDAFAAAHLLDGDLLVVHPLGTGGRGLDRDAAGPVVVVDPEGRATFGPMRRKPAPGAVHPPVPGASPWPLDRVHVQGRIAALLRHFDP